VKCGKSRGKKLTNKKEYDKYTAHRRCDRMSTTRKKLLFEKPKIPLPDVTLVFRMDCLLYSAGSQNSCCNSRKM